MILMAALAVFSSTANTREALNKLYNAEYAIRNLYVDTVNEDKLVENAIMGMLEKLDPHSSYTNAKETKALEEPLQGEFSGIGIQYNMKQDTLYVIQTVAGGPSERVGILPGDRIVMVNDTAIAGVKMSNSAIQKRLRGKKGTKVTVKVKRGADPQLITFVITRDRIPLYSVDASYMLDDKTGYIKISSFGNKTYAEMMQALAKLSQQGMKQVVVDLSDNGGGFMNAAIEMCNEFLDNGQMIVYTQGTNAPRSEAKAMGNGRYKDLKMAIIVSQYSASAAEIFTGAMQDWDRAVVVGRRTFGKGLVQRPIRFEDNSMMRLTVARYYTPSGRCIQKPYTKGNKKDYDRDVINRLNHGELTCIDSIHLDSTKTYYTLNEHRVVYGGGGIMPDIFVPLDTTKVSPMYSAINRNNLILDPMLKYADQNRKSIKRKYKQFDAYIASFEVPQALIDEILEKAKEKGIKPKDDADLESTIADLRRVLKSLIANNIWDRNEYFRLVNMESDIVNRALDFLNKK